MHLLANLLLLMAVLHPGRCISSQEYFYKTNVVNGTKYFECNKGIVYGDEGSVNYAKIEKEMVAHLGRKGHNSQMDCYTFVVFETVDTKLLDKGQYLLMFCAPTKENCFQMATENYSTRWPGSREPLVIPLNCQQTDITEPCNDVAAILGGLLAIRIFYEDVETTNGTKMMWYTRYAHEQRTLRHQVFKLLNGPNVPDIDDLFYNEILDGNDPAAFGEKESIEEQKDFFVPNRLLISEDAVDSIFASMTILSVLAVYCFGLLYLLAINTLYKSFTEEVDWMQ